MNPDNVANWVKTRKDIHSHPELKFEEERTSALVANRLEQLGYCVERHVGKTGVVGLLRGNQTSGAFKRIGLRADMDALPIQELNDFPHKSTHDGKMHACGHDGHVAMLLGAAQEFAENPEFNGEIVLIFQPGEEGGAGAKFMIEDGLFDRYPVDAVFAMHNWPGLAEGEFAVHTGPVMASSNEFKVTVKGKGSHAAMPDQGVDPVLIAAQLVVAYQSIVSRNVRPVDPAVVSVTQINAGRTINVLPEDAELRGTVRTFSIEVLDMIESRMKTLTEQLCAAYGAEVEFKFTRAYPPTINDENMAHLATKALQGLSDKVTVHTNLPPTMGAEDFAFMLQKKPGAYLWIGNGMGGHREMGHGLGPCMLHNPSYDFNDKILPMGVKAWKAIVKEFLEG